MKDFNNKTAVITGGASGIGFAIADQAAQRGMNVIIADIEQAALDSAQKTLEKHGGKVVALQADVTDSAQMESLANAALESFGAVHLMVNNAGVGGVAGPIWETELSDWKWVLDVNLSGVINGAHAFSKIMVKQNEGYIVNTASVAGLMTASGMGAYTVSKHAVVALSEALHGEFETAGVNVDVSVLCPSYIATNIGTSDRNRPGKVTQVALSKEEQEKEDERKAYANKFFDEIGMPPSQVAEKVFAAVEGRRFYILTHPDGTKKQVKDRMNAIVNDENPPLLSSADFPIPE